MSRTKIEKQIGTGGFGVVYSGQWDDGDRVVSAALKRNRHNESFSSFKDELAIWKEMQDGQLFITQFLGLVVKDSIEYVSREFRFDLILT